MCNLISSWQALSDVLLRLWGLLCLGDHSQHYTLNQASVRACTWHISSDDPYLTVIHSSFTKKQQFCCSQLGILTSVRKALMFLPPLPITAPAFWWEAGKHVDEDQNIFFYKNSLLWVENGSKRHLLFKILLMLMAYLRPLVSITSKMFNFSRL